MSGPWIAAFGALTVVVGLLAVITLGTLRRVLMALDRPSGTSASFDLGGLPLLASVPRLELRQRANGSVQFPSVVDETSIVLLMESQCAPCRDLTKALNRTDGRVNGVPVVALLEDTDEGRSFPVPEAIQVYYGDSSEIARAFATTATPYAFVIDNTGVVLERGIPNDLADLKEMAAHQRGGAD